jgi:copper chaperone
MTTTETTIEFQVTGMTCAHCEHAVSTEVGQIAGVQGVEVSATTGRLVITSDVPVSDEQVLAAVDEAGYQAVRTP